MQGCTQRSHNMHLFQVQRCLGHPMVLSWAPRVSPSALHLLRFVGYLRPLCISCSKIVHWTGVHEEC